MKNIIKAIGKFNISSLAIFTVIYITCLVLILIAINPKYKYDIEPNYDHNTGYSEINSSFQVVFKREKENNNIEETYAVRMTLNSRTSQEDKTDQNFAVAKFQAELMQTNGQEYYFDEVTNTTTSWARTTYIGEEHTPVGYYAKVKYVASNNETKVATFKEKFFEAQKSLKNYKNGNVIRYENADFTYQVVANKEDNDYIVSMRILSSTNHHFHIDLQTWILCEDGKLLPFVGMYGLSKSSWSIASERVLGELKPKAIVCKVISYYNNEEFEMHYMINMDDLKEAYVDIENIDAIKIGGNIETKVNRIIAICAMSLTLVCVITVTALCVIRVKKNKNAIEKTA